jgi:hypothetical protein
VIISIFQLHIARITQMLISYGGRVCDNLVKFVVLYLQSMLKAKILNWTSQKSVKTIFSLHKIVRPKNTPPAPDNGGFQFLDTNKALWWSLYSILLYVYVDESYTTLIMSGQSK